LEENAKKHMSKGTPPELPQPAAPPPDHFSIYRQLAGQLREALARLEAVEAEIVRVRTECHSLTSQISEMMDSDDCDLEAAANLGIRQRTYELRLERLAENQLLRAQTAVQQLCLDLGHRSEILSMQCRSVLVEEATDRMVALLHSDAQVVQRPFIGSHVAPLAAEVIDLEQKCQVKLHPETGTPLTDTVSFEFSKEREATMRLVCQEAAIVLERLPLLLECAVKLSSRLALTATAEPIAA
jgi:hypothetical protein